MKFLATLVMCLLAAALLAVVVVGDEESASSSVESSGSEEVSAVPELVESSSGESEEEEEQKEAGSGRPSAGSGDGSGRPTESGSGAAVEDPPSEIDEERVEVVLVEYKNVEEDERDAAVTLNINIGGEPLDNEMLEQIQQSLSRLIQAELARMAADEREAALRRRRRATDEFDVIFIAPTPRLVNDDSLEVVLFSRGETTVVPRKMLLAAIENLVASGVLEKNGVKVTAMYGGIPEDIQKGVVVPAARTSGERGVWREHLGLFIAIIGLAVVCLVILVIGFACLKCRSKRGSWTRADDNEPINVEDGKGYGYELNSPIPDEEIVKDEAPMTESANAADPSWSNKDWLMPMDESRPAAADPAAAAAKTDVDNTKF